MARLSRLHFYPERIAWIGMGVLGGAFILFCPSLFHLQTMEAPYLHETSPRQQTKEESFVDFSLGLKDQEPVLPLPNLEGLLRFSFDPPRPDQKMGEKRLSVSLHGSLEAKRVYLPCRLNLAFLGKNLSFSEENSPLWIELTANENQIEAQAWIRTINSEKIQAGRLISKVEEPPIRQAHELPLDSPFRVLAESKWLGKDLLKPDLSGERIELSSGEILEIKEHEWLVFLNGKWQISSTPLPGLHIGHIQSNLPKALILEGWDSHEYLRLNLGFSTGPALKMKPEELFNAIRIRSEKQISCMMEKQCLVLKLSDWVAKSGSRWKILRNKEDRDAYIRGDLLGELFILDQITEKHGQKMMQGRLFNAGRTQVQVIDLPASTNRKTGSSRRAKV